MAEPTVLRHLLTALGPDQDVPADAELLARWVADRDGGAFELLVWRHAALVLRVCRGILRDAHAAEDAAQATFLALARQAGSVGRTGSVAGWLFRVARRIAGHAARLGRKAAGETGIDLDCVPTPDPGPAADPESDRILHEELARLPEAYRVPILLCYFTGLTHAEAARRLEWPVGTVAGRLARARDLLAARLTRRGVGLAALTAAPAVAVPPAFAGATARAALAFVGNSAGLPGHVLELANREVRAMVVTKFVRAGGVLAACAVLVLGVVWAADPPAPPAPATDPPVAPAPRAAVPQIPKVVIGKTFAIAPITTDLQRRLIRGAGPLSRALVMLDGTAMFPVFQKALNLDALDLAGIRKGLTGYPAGKDRPVLHVATHYDSIPGRGGDTGQTVLEYAVEGVGWRAGFDGGLHNQHYHNNAFVFADYLAPLQDDRGAAAEENAVGDDRVRAYPVRTPLSRVLTGSAGAVVDVRTWLAPKGDDWLPAEVEKSALAALAELKLPKGAVVNFLFNIDIRTRGNEIIDRIRAAAKRWAEANGLQLGSINF